MRPDRRLIRTALLAALALSPAACGDGPSDPGPGPERRPEEELLFLRATYDTPPLVTLDTSFWAVAGENAELRIDYVRQAGQLEGDRCLEFKISGNSLLRRPDGSRIARGDSVRIRVRVVDPARFNFEFQPAGLKFDPDHPAELRIHYSWADADFNGNGAIDEFDTNFEFGIWRQERPGEPWERTGYARLKDRFEVRAELDGFTKYALAGGHRR